MSDTFEITGEEHTHCITIATDTIRAYIKWDGCCEVSLGCNIGTPSEEWERIHICGIPEFIEELQTIEKFRTEYFRKQGTLLE